ncbi:hypothetical protein EXIGLDRAFT_735681 [Exidia glandulosa HHB12029]|uniref:Inner centromere protein ARK-binding domain-containing protein n=1 Tax=Exidia glandulosa HHB12029 TaxID=1314781 RepID=A0A165PHV7_EXIGL|nr:hypothetical protein EXIGLDRAFT_735681 [Exidia glandulosa HHB12029]
MVNDPGVRDVHEYIKYQGHQWLDEYLEDILLGPAEGGVQSLADFAKTPGRRKDPLGRGRTPMRKAPAVVVNKENENGAAKPAMSAFAQKLLQAGNDDERVPLLPVGNSPQRPSPTRPSVPDVFGGQAQPQRQQTSDSAKDEKDVEQLVTAAETPAPSIPLQVAEPEHPDLSMIDETEEADDGPSTSRPPPLDLSKPTRSSHDSEYHTAPSTAVIKDESTPMDTDVLLSTGDDNTTRTFMGASQWSAGSDNTTRSFPRHTEKGFPVLKAPSPVKRESSIAPSGPHGHGARASWFVKAMATKTPGGLGAKRKSDERQDDDDESDDEESLRRKANKLLKTQADSHVKSEPAAQRDQQLRKTNGHLNTLKLTKSLGGPDAAVKAAKAAAEARLAERAGGTASTPTNEEPPKISQDEKNRRLSVSDLVTRLEEKGRRSGQKDERDESTSTTPPDSPPPRPASRPLPVPPQQKPESRHILHPPPAPVLQPPPAQAPILKPPPPAAPRESAAPIFQPPILQARPSTQTKQEPILQARPSTQTKQEPRPSTKTGSMFFPPPKFVPKSSSQQSAPPPATLPAFPMRFFIPGSPSQSFLRGAPSTSASASNGLPPLSAQSTAVSDLFDVHSQQQTQSTQDTEWEPESQSQKPFDATLVPDETRFWDKTQNRVPGAWDGAMEIDEHEHGDEWSARQRMEWSGDDEDAEEPMEVTAPAPAPAAKAGLFSAATSIISRAIYGTNPSSSTNVPMATRPAPPAPAKKEQETDPESDDTANKTQQQGKDKETSPPSDQPSMLVKSVQAAQVAKKKEQVQQTKKATIISNMEARRLANAQRKKEEEEARAAELERKQREEVEKRKREREAEEKRLRLPTKKAPSDDESNKKRKLEPTGVKKPVVAAKEKKAGGNDSRPASRIGKPNLGASTSSQIGGPSTFGGTKSQIRGPTPGPSAAPSVKLVAQPPPPQELPAPPTFAPPAPPQASAPAQTMIPTKNKFPPAASQGPAKALQEQMQARVQAQIVAASGDPPPEDIELPEINSEYSDSDDEDRARTFDPPEWATSPRLKQILRDQQRVDPDEVFGAIREINLEDIFKGDKTRHSKFRARSSSANWAGTDGLTAEEKEAYALRMGYKNTTVLSKQNTM